MAPTEYDFFDFFCFFLPLHLMDGAQVKTTKQKTNKLSLILFLVAVHNHFLHCDMSPIMKLLK